MTDALLPQLQASLGAAYTLDRELGGGGMSRVFVARDESLGRDVVIKVLSPELSATLSAERFLREIKMAAALQEPHIVPVLAAGQTAEGLPWYTMPFVTGESLRARLLREPPLQPNQAIGILKNVAQALAYAHAQHLVHRDIKPENILLSSGTAVVTDFGIAKALSASATKARGDTLTSAGTSIGTPAYMAPEQAVGDVTTDHRADVYSWGIVAYELLAGAHPFARHTTSAALVTAHLTEVPEPLIEHAWGVPDAVSDLVMKCLEKSPDARPQTMDAVLHDLDEGQRVSTPMTTAETRAAEAAAAIAKRPKLPPKPKRPREPKPIPSATAEAHATSRVPMIVAAVIVMLAVAAYFVFGRRHASAPADADRSVAVIPFENSGGDATQEYFSDGLTEELIGRLATTGLRVTGRNSSFAYKGKSASARSVGTALGVATVLTGRVRRLGDKLHVSAELASASNDAVIWTFNADRKTTDIFAVQGEMLDSIVSHFKLKPSGVGSAGTTSLEAHELYLKGHYLMRKLENEDLVAAIALYERAIKIDPNYAPAYAAIAEAYMDLADGYMAPDVAYPKAEAAARRALQLDSTLAQAWVAMAAVDALYSWKWADARREFDKALALDPGNVDARAYEAWYWGALDRPDKVHDVLALALAADPLYAIAWASLMIDDAFGGTTNDVRATWDRTPADMRDFEYGDALHGLYLLRLGDTTGAEAVFKKAEASMGHRSPSLGVIYARTGRRADAVKLLAGIEASWPKKYIPPEMVATLPDALGDTTTMYKWLERGITMRSSWAPQVVGQWKEVFVSHRNEAHFLELRRKVGAPQNGTR